jgi:hypothetical protein
MATPETIRTQLKRILAAYPQHAAKLTDSQIVDMLDVWQEDLADIDDGLLVMALRNHRERSQWLPSIAEIRASAVSLMRQASPADQDWNEAYAELQRLIGSVGYTSKPDFANPALAETVRTLGGWQQVCWNEDPEGVFRSQFRDVYQVVIARMERKVQQSATVREFVTAMTANQAPQLPAGDVAALVAQTAATMRR